MSTLVRELNSEGSDQEDADENIRKPLDFETEDVGESDGPATTAALWREEIRKRYEQESQFIAELRARNLANGQEFEDKSADGKAVEGGELYDHQPHSIRRRVSGLTDEDSYKDDEDSYVRTTDDDEGGGTDWEEAMKRWVNR